MTNMLSALRAEGYNTIVQDNMEYTCYTARRGKLLCKCKFTLCGSVQRRSIIDLPDIKFSVNVHCYSGKLM